jgi:UDPglucose 6-dehydrogenase
MGKEIPRRVLVVGAGYVGLVTAVGMATLGHEVEVIETRADRLASLRAGRVPIHEPGLQEAYSTAVGQGRLRVGNTPSSHDVEIAMVCVGTPIGEGGRADLSQLREALVGVRPLIDRGGILAIRSTLPVGSSKLVVEWLDGVTARLFSNPEFLAQGRAYRDFLAPSRIVIGTFGEPDPVALGVLRKAFSGIDAPVLVVTAPEAELIKNGANAFLALRLSYVNEIAALCEMYEADVTPVLQGIGLDPRIGPSYLSPAYGFGGSCLPKELQTLALAGLARGMPMHVTRAASEANAAHQLRFAERIAAAMGGAEGRTVAMLGLAFKAGTDDVRSSPALRVARYLLDAGATVRGYDPEASDNARRELPDLAIAGTAECAITEADAAVIATEWPEFATLDWAGLRGRMAQPVLIDGRRLLNPVQMRHLGYRYEAVGLPSRMYGEVA